MTVTGTPAPRATGGVRPRRMSGTTAMVLATRLKFMGCLTTRRIEVARQYWDNILSPLAGRSPQLMDIRYDPRNLARVFLRHEDGTFWTIPYADLRWPPAAPLAGAGTRHQYPHPA